MIGVEEKKGKPLNAAARAAQIPMTPPRQRPPSAAPPMPLRGNDSSVVRPLPPKGPAIVKIPDKQQHRPSFDDSVVTVVSELPATIAAMDHSAVTVVSTLPASLAADDAQREETTSGVHADTGSASVPVDVDEPEPEPAPEPEPEPEPVITKPDPAPLPKPVIRRKRSPGAIIGLAGIGVAGAITAVVLLRGRDDSTPAAHNVAPDVVKEAPPPVEDVPPPPAIEKPIETPVDKPVEKPAVKKPIRRPVVKKPPEKTETTGKKWDPNALFPSK